MTSPRCPEGYFPFLLRHQPFVHPVSHWVFPVKILHWSVLSLPLQFLVVLFVFTIKFCISVPLVQNLTHNVFKHFLFLKKILSCGINNVLSYLKKQICFTINATTALLFISIYCFFQFLVLSYSRAPLRISFRLTLSQQYRNDLLCCLICTLNS